MNETPPYDIPILLIIFNRPDTALEVIKAIRKVKPEKLYIAADGPRPDIENEGLLCEETRSIILNQIDWKCEIYTLFRQENLGCKEAPVSAISWLFANEEMGIILEDDCVPNESFFLFCKEILLKYKDNERVMHVSGFNEQDGHIRGKASYYFSYFSCGWGWGTWRRAWQHHKLHPEDIDKSFRKKLVHIPFYGNPKAAEIWLKQMFYNLDSAWDYQWAFAIWKNNGLCIAPNVSLIKNIGFDNRATHTKRGKSHAPFEFGDLKEVLHPEKIIPDIKADAYILYKRYHKPFLKRIYAKLKDKALMSDEF